MAATSPHGTAATVQRGTSRRGPDAAKSVSPMLDRLKQVRAGMLDVDYVEVGPGHGQPVLLLHGWPYDIHSFEEVAPALADAGYRADERARHGLSDHRRFDWGARTANVIAALWPERCRAMVSVSGYLIGSQEANRTPLPPARMSRVSWNLGDDPLHSMLRRRQFRVGARCSGGCVDVARSRGGASACSP
jgi:pimeloyl-ACP methyl ester carboxylesterase